jgi:adenylate cyclase
MSGDPEQEYFADGVVEEIITALSHFKDLLVIAQNSSFTYKGQSVDVKQVGRELGVHYVLEGSVRTASNRVRITTQLIDALTGSHLCADRFEGALGDIFDLQDRITETVIGTIRPRLEVAELERAKRKPTESLVAYDYFVRAKMNFRYPTREKNEEARALLQKAIQLDPDFGTAYAYAALYYEVRRVCGWVVDRVQEYAEAERLARRALALNADDAVVLTIAGYMLATLAGQIDEAATLIDRARVLNPNLAIAWVWSGWIRMYLGEPDLAIEHLSVAMRLNPLGLLLIKGSIAHAHFFAGRLDEASSWADKAFWDMPDDIIAVRICAASHALAGRTEQAKKACDRLRQLLPGLRISNFRERLAAYRRPEDLARLEEGLRKAGLPE